MPYEWTNRAEPEQACLTLRPYRSLPPKGFVLFIGATALLLLLPLLMLVGTALLWGILPFIVLVVSGTWWAFRRNYHDATLTEVLTLSRDRIEVVRRAPDGSEQHWSANPYWVAVTLYPTKGPVPNYLTLKGQGREVELGVFLSEQERRTLADELHERLAALR